MPSQGRRACLTCPWLRGRRRGEGSARSSFGSEHAPRPCGGEGALLRRPQDGEGRAFPPRWWRRALFGGADGSQHAPSGAGRRPAAAECAAAPTGAAARGRGTAPRTHADVHAGRGHAAAVVEVILDGEAGIAGVEVGHQGARSSSLRSRRKTAPEARCPPAQFRAERGRNWRSRARAAGPEVRGERRSGVRPGGEAGPFVPGRVGATASDALGAA